MSRHNPLRQFIDDYAVMWGQLIFRAWKAGDRGAAESLHLDMRSALNKIKTTFSRHPCAAGVKAAADAIAQAAWLCVDTVGRERDADRVLWLLSAMHEAARALAPFAEARVDVVADEASLTPALRDALYFETWAIERLQRDGVAPFGRGGYYSRRQTFMKCAEDAAVLHGWDMGDGKGEAGEASFRTYCKRLDRAKRRSR